MSFKNVSLYTKYHYVYRITNKKLNKHYIGVRSCAILPVKDLGIEYFSSSSDKEFIKDQKNNPRKYKYSIINTHPTRTSAANEEISLHEWFSVGINESFYNKAKATSTSFDVTGRRYKHTQKTIDKIIKTKNTIQENGKTNAEESAKKATITKNKQMYNKEITIQQHINNECKKTLLKIQDDGKSIAQKRVIKANKTKEKNQSAASGKNNGDAVKYDFIDKNGNIKYSYYGASKQMNKELKISNYIIRKYANTDMFIYENMTNVMLVRLKNYNPILENLKVISTLPTWRCNEI